MNFVRLFCSKKKNAWRTAATTFHVKLCRVEHCGRIDEAASIYLTQPTGENFYGHLLRSAKISLQNSANLRKAVTTPNNRTT